MERTFAIIKPDAVEQKFSGKIIDRIEQEGFKILSMRKTRLTRVEAEGFYAVHRERPFFNDLISFMTSGPVVLLALEAEGAILKWRGVMGETDPAKAPEGSLRKQFGTNIERNATHGSDAPETAAEELGYFFRNIDLLEAR
ncbi:nucleoside diphosphate kinase [Acidobacteria bacterium Mor1]|nr:nucleoside diphosphate kinase [Acidobacteria bacterium Mor1]